MRRRLFVLIALLCFIAPILSHASEDLAPHVVSVFVTQQHWDHHAPWQKYSPQTSLIFGTVISGGYILTEAHPLSDHTMIQLSKMGENRKHRGAVVLKDYNTNLALIRPEESSFFSDLIPIKLSSPGIPEEDAATVVWENGGILKTYTTSYLKSYVKTYRFNGLSLCHRMTTEQPEPGRGEPVINAQGELMGIVSNSFSSDQSVEVISVDSIRRFITDFSDGDYQGIPFYWVETSPLKGDINLKRFLGLEGDQEGLYVSRTAPYSSGSEVFHSGDVIQSINGIEIDDNGTYDDPFYGKLHYAALLFLRIQVGDSVSAQIVRKGRAREVSFPLKPIRDDWFLIQPENSDVQPGYLIWGGMLFQELSRNYLTAYGRKWREEADTRLLYLYDHFEAYPESEGERLIVLNKVFPDELNAGYQGLNNQIMETVNGQQVGSLKILKEILSSSKEPYIAFQFRGGLPVVLHREEAEKANEVILQTYGIIRASSFQN